jgi:hypothetical protein
MQKNLLKGRVKHVEESKRKVKKALGEKKIDFALNTNWPFIGSFLKFLENKTIMSNLKKITGSHIRKILSIHTFALLYILKIIVGIPTIRGSEQLLGDMGAMKLVGLNVDDLMDGLCQRGDANQYGEGYKKNTLCNGPIYINRQY